MEPDEKSASFILC